MGEFHTHFGSGERAQGKDQRVLPYALRKMEDPQGFPENRFRIAMPEMRHC